MALLTRRIALSLLKLLDLAGMVASLFLAWFLVSLQADWDAFNAFLAARSSLGNVIFLFAFLLFWNGLFSFFQMYGVEALYSFGRKPRTVAKVTALGTVTLMIAASLFKFQSVTATHLAVFWVLSTVCSIYVRKTMAHLLLSDRYTVENRKQTLIVGTNKRAQEFARILDSQSDLGHRVIGFVDDRWHTPPAGSDSPYVLLGDVDALPGFLRDHVVDEVVICLPLKSLYAKATQVVAACEEQGITVTIHTQLFDVRDPRMGQKLFRRNLTLTLYSANLDESEMNAKRWMDLLLSLIMLVMLTPLMALIAALIKAQSRGSVLFVQDRIGLNKRLFRCYKFRTMVVGAEKLQQQMEDLNEMDGAVFKMRNDPRITPIGKILRKTSLDELPQLFNVLRGDMSLVGPRPLPVRDVQRFEQDWPRRRFSFRPGITCLWQIRGRNKLPFDKWMELDMEYIDNWSLWLDVKILFQTIPAVLRCEGAY